MTLRIERDIVKAIAGVNSYGPTGNKKKFLTIHQTGNPARGADARMHAKYQHNNLLSSWHWQVK